MGHKPKKSSTRQGAFKRGVLAEKAAGVYLRVKGYKILATRYKIPVGEVDIIAKKGNTLVFVEVKARANIDDAAASITPRQQKRIAKAASSFLANHGEFEGLDCRFDAILISGLTKPTHIENAWLVEGG